MEVFPLTFFLAYAVGIAVAGAEFTSRLDREFDFNCGPKEALYFLRGNQFDDPAKDRTYTYRCKQVSRKDSHCRFEHDNWFNHVDQVLDYTCPAGEFIGGIKSIHDGEPFEDRKWMIKCCKNDEVELRDCQRTPHFLNDIRHNFEYSNHGRIFNGLYSVHYNDEHNEDRRWSVRHCDYIRRTNEDKKICVAGQGITKIYGKYNHELLDRDWKYECEPITDHDTSCYWTGFSNEMDGQLYVSCRRNHFIAGIDSYYHYSEMDRVYRIYCCTIQNLIIEKPELSKDYINELRGDINVKFHSAVNVLTGLESYHDNGQEDRRWKLEVSKYYVNDWTFKCSNDGEAIFKFESEFLETHLDRQWNWHCRKVIDSAFTDCYWTDHMNGFDQPLDGQCHGNYVLTGIGSYYSRYGRDRTWKIQCCTSERLSLGYCNTGNEFINDYRGAISYTPNDNIRVLTGLYSEHSDTFEDRIWKVSSCQFLKIPDQSFDCPDGHGLISIKSKYFKSQLDRLWNYKCVRVADTFAGDCYWIGEGDENKYINEGDKDVNANCRDGYVISSVKSSFDGFTRDRRWNTKCCRNKNAAISDCKTTPVPVNQYQRDLKVEVNINHVITGMESSHDNVYEDRRWKIKYCKFQCCQ